MLVSWRQTVNGVLFLVLRIAGKKSGPSWWQFLDAVGISLLFGCHTRNSGSWRKRMFQRNGICRRPALEVLEIRDTPTVFLVGTQMWIVSGDGSEDVAVS